jgi:hypothetical protein
MRKIVKTPKEAEQKSNRQKHTQKRNLKTCLMVA